MGVLKSETVSRNGNRKVSNLMGVLGEDKPAGTFYMASFVASLLLGEMCCASIKK